MTRFGTCAAAPTRYTQRKLNYSDQGNGGTILSVRAYGHTHWVMVPPRYIIGFTAPGYIYIYIYIWLYVVGPKWSSARAPNRNIALELLLHIHSHMESPL